MNAPLSPTIFLPLTPAMRRRIETTIEELVALLDAVDGDPDLEAANDDEEPSLGWPESHAGGYGAQRASGTDDRELDDELDEDSGDSEPDADGEPDADDEEGGDAEPNLGRLEHLHQGARTYATPVHGAED